MRLVACLFASLAITATIGTAQTNATVDPDLLYRSRDNLSSATRAADIWAGRSNVDFESAWKLARASYWLGTHDAAAAQRKHLERGVAAAEGAIRLANNRPEGHYWLAANLGHLSEIGGTFEGLKNRGRIRNELERVQAIDPRWQGGAGDEALGEWYATVPRLFGGSDSKAEQHLRTALQYEPNNVSALEFLGEMLLKQGRSSEARDLLQRAINAESDPEWLFEDRELKQKAATVLRTIRR